MAIFVIFGDLEKFFKIQINLDLKRFVIYLLLTTYLMYPCVMIVVGFILYLKHMEFFLM